MHKTNHFSKKSSDQNHSENGQGLVEYALILGFAALVVITIVNVMEFSIQDVFLEIAGNAPVAPPNLMSYTPPPTYTPTSTIDPSASDTPEATATDPANPPTETSTSEPAASDTPTSTATPTCNGFAEYPVPGRVEMEEFMCGGSAVAFADSTGDGGSGSGSFRSDVSTQGPDLATTTGGHYMGWFTNGEWVKYDVKVSSSQLYDITFRAAAANGNGRFRLEISNGGKVIYTTSSVAVPDSGGGQAWTTVTLTGVPFIQGANQISVVTENGGFNLDYFDLQKGAAAATLTHTPVAPATDTPPPTETATHTPVPSNTPTYTPTPTATTPAGSCTIYNSTDVPLTLQDMYKQGGRWKTGRTTSQIKLNSISGIITDINVLNITGTHTWTDDLDFNLISPNNTSVQIIGRGSCDNYTSGFKLSLDDASANIFPNCPNTNGTTYQPSNSLSAFNGENMRGTWDLRIDDNGRYDTGTLTAWSLEICTE